MKRFNSPALTDRAYSGCTFFVLCCAIKHCGKTAFKNKSQRDPSRQLGELSRIVTYWLLSSCSITPTGHYGCVEALVTWGADVDMDIPHLGTALYTACVCQELECARKLLREGQRAAPCYFTSPYRRANTHTQIHKHSYCAQARMVILWHIWMKKHLDANTQ